MKSTVSLVLLAAFHSSVASSGRLDVVVHGVRNDSGRVLVSLYDRAAGFPRERSAVADARTVDARRGDVTVRFSDLPHGDYAVAVLHDENVSGDMDTGFLGIPKEGFAFSNDVNPRFRAPSFDDTKFTIGGLETSVALQMRYR